LFGFTAGNFLFFLQILTYFPKLEGNILPSEEEFLAISGFDDSNRIFTAERNDFTHIFENFCPNNCQIPYDN